MAKKYALVVTCLFTNHVTIENIDNFCSYSIAMAVRRIGVRYCVRVQSIWTDAFSSLKEGTLGDYLRGSFEVYHNLKESYPDIKFHTNMPFTKQRNYVERRIRDIKGLLRQIQAYTPHAKIALVPQEWDNLILMIESHLNNIPYKVDSLMTPSSLINH